MPLACFQCTDTLLFAAKHAKGMSLRYDVLGYLTPFKKFDAFYYQAAMVSSGVFRRATASGFYPWGKVEGPRERVAEGLCGGRH